jgi:hypothetical protein
MISDYACFEIYDKDGCPQASTEGPREEALKEAIHYVHQYGLDGPMQIFEVIRIPVVYHND